MRNCHHKAAGFEVIAGLDRGRRTVASMAAKPQQDAAQQDRPYREREDVSLGDLEGLDLRDLVLHGAGARFCHSVVSNTLTARLEHTRAQELAYVSHHSS